MASKEILEYYEQTFDRKTREDLVFSTSLVEDEKIALDCGCGAGSDIAYLRKKGFMVYAFDIEQKSIDICLQRFRDDNNVILSQDSFSSFRYPKTSLVNADASLFFCSSLEIENVWRNIEASLALGGIFCGSFLGPEDSMAGPGYDSKALWPDALVYDQNNLMAEFQNFEIIRFTEHKSSGKATNGQPHDWHIYSIVAKKIQ